MNNFAIYNKRSSLKCVLKKIDEEKKAISLFCWLANINYDDKLAFEGTYNSKLNFLYMLADKLAQELSTVDKVDILEP